MHVEISPRLYAHRGGDVEVGNVYSNDHSRYFRVVIAIAGLRKGRVPWNSVVCIHVDATGEVTGASCQPINYMREHQDLIGKVKQMPSMKIEWFRTEEDKGGVQPKKLRRNNRK